MLWIIFCKQGEENRGGMSHMVLGEKELYL